MEKHFKYISEGLNLYTKKMMVSLILMVKSGGMSNLRGKIIILVRLILVNEPRTFK